MYKSKMDLDEIDIGILNMLRENADRSLGEMGKELGVSASTIHKRVIVLKENKIINCFTITFDPAIINLKTTAFVGVELEREALTGKKKDKVLEELAGANGVMEVHETLAPFDLFLKVRTTNVEALRKLIGHIASIDGVQATNTILTTSRVKESLW